MTEPTAGAAPVLEARGLTKTYGHVHAFAAPTSVSGRARSSR
jgi:hypothetical protein